MEPKGSIGVETTVEWIKKNMIEPYTENLERPLTEYEIRVQRALERLPIPHWYRQYSKPFKILKRHQAADSSSSPSPWKSTKGKQSSKGTKQPSSKSRGQKNSQRKVQSATLDRSKHDFDEAYYSSCQSPEEEEASLKSSNSSSSSSIYDSELAKDKELWTLLENLANVKTPEKRCRSFTLPRISPTRKVDNINIVLPSPGSQKDSNSCADDDDDSKSSRYLTTLLHDMSLEPGLESNQTIEPANNYATLFFADLQPEGLQSCVYMHAEMTEVSSCEERGDDELEWQSEEPEDEQQLALEEDTRSTIIGSTTSLNTRFLKSENKSRMLEKIVQKKRRSKSSLIQNIISELERSLVLRTESGSSCSNAEQQPDSGSFVRDLVSALEHNDEEEEEGQAAKELVYVTDSELARSFSSLSLARDDSSVDEEPIRPSYSYPEEQEEEEESEDEGELWISACKQEEEEEEPRSALLQLQPPPRVEMAHPGRQLARTSSQIAGRASSSRSFAYASGRCSPGLSPIRASRSTSACKLGSESSVPDSGYSDRSSGRSSRPQYCREVRRGPGSSCDSSDWEAGRSSSPSTRAPSPAILSSDSDCLDDTPKRASRPYASRSIYV